MNLLYFSCHAILEYDELRIFEELGINYFSLGSYVDPTHPVDPIRPPLSHRPDPWLVAHAPDRRAIPKEFVDRFDTIVVMDYPQTETWIQSNWEIFKGKTVIWRTIGQSNPAKERRMWEYRQRGMKVVRYSFREANIDGTIGSDKVIRFYKDPNEFNLWNGLSPEVITFAQDMKTRAEYCNYSTFLKLVEGFPAKLYGPKNEGAGGLNGGFLTYDGMRQKLRDGRVYLYMHTQPASYTLSFIEALMTGIPVVAIGPKYADSLNIAGNVYEIPDIIQNATNGFWSDNLDYLRKTIKLLLSDRALSKRIGDMGRQTAIKLFGKNIIKQQWKDFLKV